MSKAAQDRAGRLAAAIHRGVAAHDPLARATSGAHFGFGELERFFGGPPALDALKLTKHYPAALDAALAVYGLRVRAWTRNGITVAAL